MLGDIIRRSLPRSVKDYVGALVHPPVRYEADFSPDEIGLCRDIEPFTMTGPEAVVVLSRTVASLVQRGVAGAFVECGVWRGGSMMVVAKTLLANGVSDRELVLFDTFEGMTPPSARDRDALGRSAEDVLASHPKVTDRESMWCIASEVDVRTNLESTGYPTDRIRCVRGRVEDSLPAHAPTRIALLRLDTDWYESTKHELEALWDRLVVGGVLILDDYGLWQGQRDAVDEFFAARGLCPLLTRVDNKARLLVKEAPHGHTATRKLTDD